MKNTPPDNLPVVPPLPEDEEVEDVHFRGTSRNGTVALTQSDGEANRPASAPAPRSLQPINSGMTERKERPIRAPDDLLSVDDVAERLLVSRAAVYRMVAQRRLPFYRLPAGIRFKVTNVDSFLESHLNEASPSRPYGSPQD